SGGSFIQSGGTHIVNGVLSITGSYDLSAGNLTASGIWMHGRLSVSSTASITSPGPMDFGGTLHVEIPVSLGPLKLTDNGTIEFGSGPAVLRFHNSSGLPWSTDRVLTISNWHGSTS